MYMDLVVEINLIFFLCDKQLGNDLIIVGGDWNVAFNMKVDVRNYLSIVTRPRARKKIFDLMTNNELVDIFRKLYPDNKSYTWRKFNTTKQARLYYFLISEELVSEVIETKVKLGYRSDHRSVVNLTLRKDELQRDRPF